MLTASTAISGTGETHDLRIEAKLRRELGAQALGLLEESGVEDVLLNCDGVLWVKRAGHRIAVAGRMENSRARGFLYTVAAIRGRVLNEGDPIISTELPIAGSPRLEGIVRPVVSGVVFALRKPAARLYSLDDYEGAGILTREGDHENRRQEAADFAAGIKGLTHREVLQRAIRAKKNILVAGSTGSGKTTLINALLCELGARCPDERVLIIEDTAELQCGLENHVSLLATGKVTMLDCLRSCMRLKPDRIVVGEVRGGEAHTLLKAWNTGHPGGFASLHANDARSALSRLETLVNEATISDQRALIGEAIDLVVFIDEASSAVGRKVRECLLVDGFANGEYRTRQV